MTYPDRNEAGQVAVRFADHWKAQTGHYPTRLPFDGRVTTYAELHALERRIGSITIRRCVRGVSPLPENVL